MNAESLAFLLLALGILGAHVATLRLLTACKAELSQHMAVQTARAESSHGHLEEVVRIGSDVADALEGLIVGVEAQGGAPSAVLAPAPNMRDTMIQLMLDRFLGGLDASQAEQERAVHQEPTTPKDDQPSEPATPNPA